MKYINYILIVATMFAFSGNPTHAATISPGDLIKASGPAVYYYSSSGKRLVFPTEKTFKTWYGNFDTVKAISDTELAAIGLGGNVTYKPGVKLVKITTDPKVYAIGMGGSLRHIGSEQIAASLYGPDWATKVDDIPDAFFVNYKIGSAILAVNDFTPSLETAAATTIDTDRSGTTPQTPTTPTTPTSTPPVTPTSTTGQVTLSVSNSIVRPGDVITLSTEASHPSGISKIDIFYDNNLVTTCNFSVSCSGQAVIPVAVDKNLLEIKTVVTAVDQTSITKTANITVDRTTAVSDVNMRADQIQVRNGQSTGLTAEAQNLNIYRLDMYVNGSAVKVCQSGIKICLLSYQFTGATGSTNTAYAIVTDTIGRTYKSNTVVITIADNDSPTIKLEAGKQILYVGETVDITASASDGDGIKYTEVLDTNKNLIKHCDGAAPCTIIAGPWTATGTQTYYARAEDLLGGKGEQMVMVTVAN